jgi:hypothetical protein
MVKNFNWRFFAKCSYHLGVNLHGKKPYRRASNININQCGVVLVISYSILDRFLQIIPGRSRILENQEKCARMSMTNNGGIFAITATKEFMLKQNLRRHRKLLKQLSTDPLIILIYETMPKYFPRNFARESFSGETHSR